MGREVFAGNLPMNTDEEMLHKLFSVSGRVVSVRPIIDAITGKSKGCAYIKMGSDAEAADAVATLDGALIEGRKITVEVSTTKAQRMRTSPPQQEKPLAKKSAKRGR